MFRWTYPIPAQWLKYNNRVYTGTSISHMKFVDAPINTSQTSQSKKPMINRKIVEFLFELDSSFEFHLLRFFVPILERWKIL